MVAIWLDLKWSDFQISYPIQYLNHLQTHHLYHLLEIQTYLDFSSPLTSLVFEWYKHIRLKNVWYSSHSVR